MQHPPGIIPKAVIFNSAIQNAEADEKLGKPLPEWGTIGIIQELGKLGEKIKFQNRNPQFIKF